MILPKRFNIDMSMDEMLKNSIDKLKTSFSSGTNQLIVM